MASSHVRRLARVALLLTVGFLPPGDGRAEENVAVGLGSFEFSPGPHQPPRPLKVWTCRPETCGPDSPIVIVMHGVLRNGQSYRDAWAPHSRRYGFLLLVPEFPEADYSIEAYQQGHVVDRDGRAVAPEAWTFHVIERLFDHARMLTGSRAEKYYLYGHSGGGQFVHRFVLFMPQARYARAIAANSGFYTVPTQAAEYPYGLKGTPVAGTVGPAVFGRDVVVMLGTEDTQRDDPNLKKTPEADAQGLNRLQRGMNYYRIAKELAEESQATFNWRLVTVPGVGHSNEKMSESAARELFAEM